MTIGKSAVLVFFLLMMVHIGCGIFKANNSAENVFKAGDYNLVFTFPKEWKIEKEENPYDLQVTDGKAYANVFAYEMKDLSENQTPMDIYQTQKSDLFSKRNNVKVISESKRTENNVRIHSEIVSAEKDGHKNHYYCNLVDLNNGSGIFAWVVFTAIPSHADKNTEKWNHILATARNDKK